MKKKTKLKSDVPESPAKSRQRGPKQAKTQVTIRIDQDLLSEAYVQMKRDGSRLTDIIERGIYLALRELNNEMTHYTRQVRFAVANTTRVQQQYIRGLLVAMAEMEVVSLGQGKTAVLIGHKCADRDRVKELLMGFLEDCNKQPDADDLLDYYKRYGKSPEEIAKLASL